MFINPYLVKYEGDNMENSVIQTILNHKSIRKYTDEIPSDDMIFTIIRAGQQAPFASQLYSILLSRNKEHNPYGAPLLFTICVDSHKLELIMASRNWELVVNDLSILIFGIQDASLMAENMVIAGRSLGLGSCFIGSAPYRAQKISKEYDLPKRVFPIVQLAMGYPAEDPPTRPRYPLKFTLFEDKYPKLTQEMILKAKQDMDDGHLAQDYYRKLNAKIPLIDDREETHTYDTYSWTEHISRRYGQTRGEGNALLEQLHKSGFHIIKLPII